MEIYIHVLDFRIFSPFSGFCIMILSYTLILPMSLLQTQKVMTSQNRSHIEYLMQTQYYCSHFVIKIDENSSLNTT